jgi:hypothetical protein
MVGVNFAIASDFRWLLLALALPWAVALAPWAARRRRRMAVPLTRRAVARHR